MRRFNKKLWNFKAARLFAFWLMKAQSSLIHAGGGCGSMETLSASNIRRWGEKENWVRNGRLKDAHSMHFRCTKEFSGEKYYFSRDTKLAENSKDTLWWISKTRQKLSSPEFEFQTTVGPILKQIWSLNEFLNNWAINAKHALID